MGGDDAQQRTLEFYVDDHCASGLESWQTYPLDTAHNTVPREDQISMPTMAWSLREVSRRETGREFEPSKIQEAVSAAQRAVSFLKRNQVRIDLADDFRNSTWVKYAVGTDAFVNIIGGDGGARVVVMKLKMLGGLFPKSVQQRPRKRRRAREHGFPRSNLKAIFLRRSRFVF